MDIISDNAGKYPSLQKILISTLLFGILAWGGVAFTRDAGRIAAVWLPNAVLVAFLMRGSGKGDWVLILSAFMANVAANLLGGDDPVRAAGLAMVNSIEIGLIWSIMRWLGRPRPDMSNLEDLLMFAVVGGGLAPAAAAIVAILFLAPPNFFSALGMWRTWLLTDGMGMLIVAPAFIILYDHWKQVMRLSGKRIAEIFVILLACNLGTIGVFYQTSLPLLFLVAPFILLFAFRFGAVGAAIAVLNTAVIASLATAWDMGPIHLVEGDISDKILVLQIFLASNFALSLPVAAILVRKDAIEAQLQRTRDQAQSMLENMRETIFRTDANGCWEFLNPAWEVLTGYRVQDSIGWHSTKLVHPDEKNALYAVYPKIESGEIEQTTLKQRFLHADGTSRHIEISMRALRDKAGKFTGAIGNIRDVTEAYRHETQLRDSEERFRRMAEAAPVGIYRADAQGGITYANRAWSAKIGLTVEEALGNGWMSKLKDPSPYEERPAWEGFTESETIRRRTVVFEAVDGSDLWIETVSCAEFDEDGNLSGFVGVTIDITEQRKANEALVESKRVFETLAALSPAGIFRANAAGECTYYNNAWLTLSGLSPEKALGNGWADALHKDDRIRVLQEWQDCVARRETYRSEFRFSRPDGQISWVDVIATPETDEDGKLIGYIGVNMDISNRKILERQLISAMKNAEAAAVSKSNFLANMSHEIRTPMNGVLGFAELLLETGLDETQRKYAQLIADSGQAMMRLLNDILDISKVEAGQMNIVREPVQLRHVVDSCLKLLSANAAQKGLSLEVEYGDDVPDHIIGDGLRIRQVLLNLIGNAIKFTLAGKVTVSVSAVMDRSGKKADLSINVRDTGVGIPASRIEAIFQPFEQADDSTVRKFGGTGLGLTISRQLVRLMGGELSVKSTAGHGSCFRIDLPSVEIGTAGALRTAIGSGSENGASRSKVKGIRILLAEDHDVNQLLIRSMLEQEGYIVDVAVDGTQAHEKVVRTKGGTNAYHVVLMDIQMPEMDGFEATRLIRASGIDRKTLPIIALTANAYAEDIAACQKAGMQAHIAKPVDRKLLLSTLEKWTSGRPAKPDPVKPDSVKSEPVTAPSPSPDPAVNDTLLAKYGERRQETLDAVNRFLKKGLEEEAGRKDLLFKLHKLAGTAAIFGEPDLGSLAAEMEALLEPGLEDIDLKNCRKIARKIVKDRQDIVRS